MQVSKWGNSLAVRLPKKLVEQMKLAPGDEVNIVHREGRALMIEKVNRRNAALERMSKRNWRMPEGFRFDRDEANDR